MRTLNDNRPAGRGRLAPHAGKRARRLVTMAPVAGLFSSERAKAVLHFYTGSPEFLRLIAERVNGTGA